MRIGPAANCDHWSGLFSWGSGVAVLLLLSTVFTFGNTPSLNAVSPTGGQRGTELLVTFEGARLHTFQELLFYSPGISTVGITSSKSNAVIAKLRIAEDCRLGEHHLRVRTSHGVSQIRSFYVGALPTVSEKEPNNESSRAQSVGMNSTVAGVITPDDTDCFQVSVQKDELISVEIEGIRLGRTLFDPYISLLSPAGKKIAECDDTALLMQDGFLSVRASESGKYTVLVRDSAFGGNSQYHYRLHIGHFPRPSGIFPPGGKAGEVVEFRFLGLPGAAVLQQSVKLPAEAMPRFGVFAMQDTNVAPSPNWIRVSPFPNVLESGSNHQLSNATFATVMPPFALNGILSDAGQADWFKFEVATNQNLSIAVYGRRLRSPLDSVLELYDAKGKRLQQNDDAAGPDSQITFTPSSRGPYYLKLSDQLGRGGADYVYRVEVTPTQPELSVFIPQVARNDSQSRQFLTVARGNRFASVISAKRVSFNDALTLEIDNLPREVTLRGGEAAARQNTIPIVVEASTNAVVGGKLLEMTVVGAGSNDLAGSFQHELEFVYGPPNNTPYYTTQLDKIAVAVVEELPFKIDLVPPGVPLVQNGKMDLKVVAHRKEGFDAPITLRMLWNPPGLGSQTEITIPKGAKDAIYRVNANGNAEKRTWNMAILATAIVEGGAAWASSQLIPLEVAAPFLTTKMQPTSIHAGSSLKLPLKIALNTSFEGEAVARLLGLPEKITAGEVKFTKESSEITFEVAAASDAMPGTHKGVFCEVVIQQQGEPIVHQTALGGVLRVLSPTTKSTPSVAQKASK